MPKAPLAENLDLLDLINVPREALDIEVKDWLDLSDNDARANVAKEIIALANHGGGYLVIGFTEASDGTFAAGSAAPSSLSAWSQDAVQSIVAKYIDPVFQCRVSHVEGASAIKHPVIEVPGGHRVPVRAKSGSPDAKKLIANRIYIRRAGPCSEEPRTAEEWDKLLDRLVKNRQSDLLDAMRQIVSGVLPADKPAPETTIVQKLWAFEERAAKRWDVLVSGMNDPNAPPSFKHGYYESGFALEGSFDRPTLKSMKDIVASSVRNHSGWPPFLTIDRSPYSPSAIDGVVESWLGPDTDGSYDKPSHHDFWRASPDGFLFTRRGYQEDGGIGGFAPGTTFDITTPTWRLGEAILEASYIAQRMSVPDGQLFCHARWTGLAGRKLVSLGNQNRVMMGTYVSKQDTYGVTKGFPVKAVGTSLPEIVWSILSDLYELFGFFFAAENSSCRRATQSHETVVLRAVSGVHRRLPPHNR